MPQYYVVGYFNFTYSIGIKTSNIVKYLSEINNFSAYNIGYPRALCMNSSLLIKLKLKIFNTMVNGINTELASCSRLGIFNIHIHISLHLGT